MKIPTLLPNLKNETNLAEPGGVNSWILFVLQLKEHLAEFVEHSASSSFMVISLVQKPHGDSISIIIHTNDFAIALPCFTIPIKWAFGQ